MNAAIQIKAGQRTLVMTVCPPFSLTKSLTALGEALSIGVATCKVEDRKMIKNSETPTGRVEHVPMKC
jgi:hypothetical protein